MTRPPTEPIGAASRHATGALTSPLFVISVLTLMMNDFVLKQLMPGLVTGKLSDIAGLFALAVFAAALLPAHRRSVHVVIAVAFTFWKSPLSQPLIDAFNSIAPARVGRVIDWTDLIALGVLPLSFSYSSRRRPPRKFYLRLAVTAVALFSFAATSFHSDVQYDLTLFFDGSPEELAAKLREHGVSAWIPSEPATATNEYSLWIPAPEVCSGHLSAELDVQPQAGGTRIVLRELAHRCPRNRDDKARLLRAFNRTVVVPLKMRPAA